MVAAHISPVPILIDAKSKAMPDARFGDRNRHARFGLGRDLVARQAARLDSIPTGFALRRSFRFGADSAASFASASAAVAEAASAVSAPRPFVALKELLPDIVACQRPRKAGKHNHECEADRRA